MNNPNGFPEEGPCWKKENNGEEFILCTQCNKLHNRDHGYILFHEHPTPDEAWFCLKCILMMGKIPLDEMTLLLKSIGYPEEQ